MKWVEHVKEFATRKGITYRQALKENECKETYHKQKGEQKEIDKGNKKFKEHQENKDLLIVGTPSISVPDKMLLITSEGEEKVIHPLTKNKTLARKDKQNIIKIGVSDDNKLHVNSAGVNMKDKERHRKSALQRKFDRAHADNTMIDPEINVLEFAIRKETKRIQELRKPPPKTLEQLEQWKAELKELKGKHAKNEDKQYMYGGVGYKDYLHEVGRKYKD